jgi:cell division protein FtsQ
VNDPQGDVLVELGSGDYLKRYRIYVSHVQEWRQQFQKLESVNLRYDNQVIVNPDLEGKPKQAALTVAAAKAAVAAGVKPAALITHLNPHDHSIPKPAFELTEKKLDPKTAAKKPAARTRAKKVVARKPARKEPAKHTPKTYGKKPSAAVAANTTSPKPSPAVARPSTGPN